jgi:hypothetical protein
MYFTRRSARMLFKCLCLWTPAEPDASIAGYPENRRKYFFQGIEHVFARDVVNAMSLVGFDFDAAFP